MRRQKNHIASMSLSRMALQAITLAVCLLGMASTVSAQGAAVQFPLITLSDNDGNPCNGCKLYVFAAGTSTPLTTYTNSTLQSANAHPIVLDSSGRATVFMGTSAYKLRLDTSADVVLWTVDGVTSAGGGGGALAVTSVASDYTVLTSDNLLLVTGTRTLTLPTAVGSAGKTYLVKQVGSGTVTLDGNGVQTIEGVTTWLVSGANAWTQIVSDNSNWRIIGISEQVSPGLCECRLTLTTGTPVTTSDVTAAGTIYLTTYGGNRLSLYDGARWAPYTFTEVSLALTVTADTNYDVYLYDNVGTLTLETTGWTNDTTRATALAAQNGVYVKTGATGRKYVGTIRASASNQTEDSAAKRLVWNYFNRVDSPMRVLEATDSWNYTTATLRQARASTANQLALVVGVAEDTVSVSVTTHVGNDTGGVSITTAIGADSTSVAATGSTIGRVGIDADVATVTHQVNANLEVTPAQGYHFYAWLEYSTAAGTTTWYGDSGSPTLLQSGISGKWRR